MSNNIILSTFTSNFLLSIFPSAVKCFCTQNFFVTTCSRRPCSTSTGSYCKLQALLLYLHVICFRPLSSAALYVIALHRLLHYLSPCGVLAHLCTLVCNNNKKKKEKEERLWVVLCWLTASFSKVLSPFLQMASLCCQDGVHGNHVLYTNLTHELNLTLAILFQHLKQEDLISGFLKTLLTATFILCKCITSFSNTVHILSPLGKTKKKRKRNNALQ